MCFKLGSWCYACLYKTKQMLQINRKFCFFSVFFFFVTELKVQVSQENWEKVTSLIMRNREVYSLTELNKF
jgi:hypothetical protein